MINKITKYIKHNYVVRNIILAISIFFILLTGAFIFLDIYTRHGEKFIIPELSGLSLSEAQDSVKNMESRLVVIDSLFVITKKAGVILEQNPKAGSPVKRNRRILLTINSTTPQKITLPYVAGYSLRQAKNKLMGAGIEISKIIYQRDIATNNVITQKYKGKTISENSNIKIPMGSKVELIVGLAAYEPRIKVPATVGLSINDAKSILWENGFNVGKIHYSSDTKDKFSRDIRVYKQSKNPEHFANRGSAIQLYATSDKTVIDEAKEKVQTMYKNISLTESKLERYKDTLEILRVKTGKNTIENKNGIVAPEDSLFYKRRIQDLKYTLSNIDLE